MNHIRIMKAVKFHRRGGLVRPGQTRTLCGGEMTDRDLSWGDAKQCDRAGELADWLHCPTCRRMVEGRSKA